VSVDRERTGEDVQAQGALQCDIGRGTAQELKYRAHQLGRGGGTQW